MKRIYETFSEIATDFVDGEHWTHQLSKHPTHECFGWMHGVREFAEWLDASGIDLLCGEDPSIHEKLWKQSMENRRRWSPDSSCPIVPREAGD